METINDMLVQVILAASFKAAEDLASNYYNLSLTVPAEYEHALLDKSDRYIDIAIAIKDHLVMCSR